MKIDYMATRSLPDDRIVETI